jgi:formylglycine-generating enzyme required for sulfatase activity
MATTDSGPLLTRYPFEPEMVLIPAGPFLMGSPRSDQLRFGDEPIQFELNLNYDYAIGRYPVTVGQYRAFIDAGGYSDARWWTDAGLEWRSSFDRTQPDCWGESPWTDSDDLPVVYVSWYEAYAYTRWLAEATGRDYRLLTEAEWEKAARGGMQENPNPARIWPWGDEEPTPELCNFSSNYQGGRTSPVTSHAGQAERQPYGLYHMAGNIWEWCLSEWANPYQYREYNGPEGSSVRVLRGGSWNNAQRSCRVSARYDGDPGTWLSFRGFRVGGVVPVLP